VYTLHGYALRQLMAARVNVGSGRGHARVADDWEERHIVEEDLKALLGETRVKRVRERLARLAAAWEASPDPAVEDRHPDNELVGALRQHKGHYRYILRSELVYRLKEQFDANPYFPLTGTYKFVVVDEYQDLNRCDVVVIDAIAAAQGAALFVAGDDDQSIYQQLRNAHPQAIREFIATHGAADLALATCVRCDRGIIELAHNVISQEVGRIDKRHEPHISAGPGIVESIAFRDGVAEARGIAALVKKFTDAGVDPGEILILLRSDRNGAFSDPIEAELAGLRIPAVVRSPDKSAVDTSDGRALIALLRLTVEATDELAWRTALKTGRVGTGDGAIEAIHAYAASTARVSFSETIILTEADSTLIPSFGVAIQRGARQIRDRLAAMEVAAPLAMSTVDQSIDAAASQLPATPELTAAVGELKGLTTLWAPTSLVDFLGGLALRKEEEEAIVPKTVNIMTAHKAKGLDACVVIIAAAEEELFPGAGNVDEERRLFYVSLTRAKHALFITNAIVRSGTQVYSGTGGRTHQRTQFLDTSGLVARPGGQWIASYMPSIALLSPITTHAPAAMPATG
jgi:DNA helicase II / ATP-dependent DNA helicase PcrA